MEKTPQNQGEEPIQKELPSGEDLLPSAKSVASDPVKEALAIAESVAPGPSEYVANKPTVEKEINESTSLMQVIDQVEQRLTSSLEHSDVQIQSLPEELDALDIEADLGRPEKPVEVSTVSKTSPSQDEVRVDESELQEEKETKTETDKVPLPDDTMATSERATVAVQQSGLRLTNGFRQYGKLSDDPLWTLLSSVLVDRFTGALVLDNSGIERRLVFDGGEIVIATSTAREDRLVELLYREGRLSDEEYSQAVLAVGASGRRVGAVLVERGLISSRELFPLVRHHYESIILDSFAWREGSWRLELDKGLGGERILLNVPTPTIIVEGIRSRALPKDIDALVPRGSEPLETPSGICRIEDVGLLPEEAAISSACDGSTTIDHLVQRFGIPDDELRGLIAGLSVLGLLHVKAVKGEIDDQDETRPPAVRRGSEHSFRVARSRVSDKMAQVKEGSYYAILEISPKASGYEIRKAYRSLVGQFALERFAIPELADLQSQVELIQRIIDEAYEVLRNPDVREAYRKIVQEEL
ncbi:MAG: DUF4388 domain-containing protein [Proteobacteria bacterium]|nr:DUF4388 domain-containing protein [Pseudomonadota bacterium]